MSKLSKLIHKIPAKTVAGLAIIVADTALKAKGIDLPLMQEIGLTVAGVGAWSKLVKIQEAVQIVAAAKSKKPTAQ